MKIDISGSEMASPEPPDMVTEDAPLFTLSTSTTPCLNKMHARPTLAEQNLLNAVPVIGIAHIYTEEDEDFLFLSVKLVTVFLGPNAQTHCDKFQSDLLENWKWYEFAHQTLAEQPWEHLLEKTFMLFIMAESFDPSIQFVLQRANLFNVTAVVITHSPATFPDDLFPILHVADGLDFSRALRSVIGASVSDAPFGSTDLGDIRACFRESRRLIQRMDEVPDTKLLPFAAKRVLQHANILDADMTGAKCVLCWISAGLDVGLDDFYAVREEICSWIFPECEVILGVSPEPSMDGVKRVVLTIGWN